MVSTWKPGGIHWETMWYQCGNHIVSTCVQKRHGVQVPCRNHVVLMLTKHGYHVDTTWFPGVYHMVCMWTACGFHVDTMWFPCGPHVVSRWIPHHFQITSVANWSRKVTNLWKPITSLIMVRFSIRKKFWKALGLLYQLVLFLCHSYISGNDHIFSLSAKSHCKVMWPP